jgi:hypothetical protein
MATAKKSPYKSSTRLSPDEQRRGRKHLAQTLREHYTSEVKRQTLALNKQLPIHEK